jgi:ParB/RepB/Spo0J family partition protein
MPNQPRSEYDDKYINDLVETFKTKGFKGALTVWKPSPDIDEYEIISGHCRFLALQKMGETEVSCAVYEGITESEAYELAVLFNEQRQDLSLYELSLSYQTMIDKYGKDIKALCKTFQSTPSTVTNVLSVLKQPEYLKEQAHLGKLTLFDINILKQIDDEDQRVKYAKKVVSGDIAKTRLNDEVKMYTRKAKVLAAIPNLTGEALDAPPKESKAGRDIFIPPDFKLYFTLGAAVRVDWQVLPQKNILVSAYHILHARARLPMVEDIINKRKLMDSLMIDSSSIIAMDKNDTDWFKRQKEVVALANAVDADTVVMLDVLCKPKLLDKCGMSVQEAQAITIENAEKFMKLETNARKVYVLQGYEKREYMVCINAFHEMGIFENDNNIIGVGSSAGEKMEKTLDRYKFCCDNVHRINPRLGIHAFGIGSPKILVELYKYGVTQVDNQTPTVQTRINKWINPEDGEAFQGLTLAEKRNTAMYNAQMLWNYGAYFAGVNNLFAKMKGDKYTTTDESEFDDAVIVADEQITGD